MSLTFEEWCLDRGLDPEDWEAWEEWNYLGSEAARSLEDDCRIDERILRKYEGSDARG